MLKSEFNKAFAMANDPDIPLIHVDYSVLHGCALPEFKYPVHCTTEQLAAMIRWQGQYLFGGWNSEELDQLAKIGKKKFILLD